MVEFEAEFDINAPVLIKQSGQSGVVQGVYFHRNTEPQYLVRYVDADHCVLDKYFFAEDLCAKSA